MLGIEGIVESARKNATAGLIATVAFFLWLAISGAPAFGAVTHPYTGVSIGPFGTSTEAGNKFNRLESVAVDSTSGDVYAFDAGEGGKLYKFTSSGQPSEFSALGTNVIENVGSAGADENEIAIAPVGAPGGTAGDIYVARFGSRVAVYSPEGELLGNLGGSGSCGVAVNPSGDVFISEFAERIRKFTPMANPVVEGDQTGESQAAFPFSCNIAVDGLGNVYAAEFNGATVTKLEGLGDTTPQSLTPGGRTVAIDPSTNDLYVDNEARVTQFNSSGAVLGAFGGSRLGASRGIAISKLTGEVFVANGKAGTVDAFGPNEEAKPIVSNAQASNVSSTEATLSVEVNPNGESTTVYAEFGTTEAYGQKTPSREIGDQELFQPIVEPISGLLPGTTYHFRWVATSGSTIVTSEDRTFSTPNGSALGESCSNQPFRSGASAALPDCRAYEMVSPIFKNGDIASNVDGSGIRPELNQSAFDGNSLAFSSSNAFAGSSSANFSNQYEATRTGSGWLTKSISPPKRSFINSDSYVQYSLPFLAFSDDLSRSWVRSDTQPGLAPGALPSFINLYERARTGEYQALSNSAVQPVEPITSSAVPGAEFEGVTPDSSHRVIATTEVFTGNVVNISLYSLHDGLSELVSVLPNGTPLPHTEELSPSLGSSSFNRKQFYFGQAWTDNAISADGSHIFWSAQNPIGNTSFGTIYVRIGGVETKQVSGARPAFFRGAARNGSVAYFEQEDSETEAKFSLWRFDTATSARTKIAEDVIGVMGVSDDGSVVYFISGEVLAKGAKVGEPNLYVYDGTSFSLIGTLGKPEAPRNRGNVTEEDPTDTSRSPLGRASRVSADGRYAVFFSTQPLTGYDNRDSVTGVRDTEIFRYDRLADQLICVSCNPTGARPYGHGYPFPFRAQTAFFSAKELSAAAWITTSTSSAVAPRVLSDDGRRVFFNSFDRLVPKDVNSSQDVYEWEAFGVGNCRLQAGCVALLSSGQGGRAEFVDADGSGANVFISTPDSLVSSDPGERDVYDVRELGGLPEMAVARSCDGEACQSGAAVPPQAVSGTANFSGPGNPKVKRHKHHHKKHKKKAGHRGKSKSKHRVKPRSASAGEEEVGR